MRQLAVIPVATGVLRSDLMQMRQLRDEPFRAFAARVRGKADTCAFIVNCTRGLKVNYTDHMIRSTLLNDIADDEIRREILGSANVLTHAVNEIVALVESKEMARNAVPPTEVISVSAVQLLHHTPTADHKTLRNTISRREFNSSPARSKQSRCPLCQRLYQFLYPIPNFINCVLNATRHKNTEDATSLLKWVLHHLNQAYKLLKSRRVRTLS